MVRFANKTFFRFLIGFLAIISTSFLFILGATYLAEVDAQKNTAQVSEEGDCVGPNC